ncbi:unnamed protein product [Cochlearia groenlandica]
MASFKLCRLSTKLQSLTHKMISKKNVNVSSLPSPIKSPSPSSANTHLHSSFRLPVELSSCLSMFPLHNAIATSRLVSSLSVESKCWCLVPQGQSLLISIMPCDHF